MRASIIIPVFAAEDYIADCLTSVLRQTVSDYEVICVDDGSPDNSRQIIERFMDRDSRVRLIRQSNGGAASARNAGYTASKADYVTFVDADDEITTHYLEVLLEAINEHDADIALANKYVSQGGKTKPREPLVSNGLVDGSDFQSNGIFTLNAPHAKLYHKKFLNNHSIRYFEGITYEDYVYWVDCLSRRPKVSTSSEFVYIYKKNPNSISSASQKLSPFNLRSRIIQTNECLRIAAMSDIEGMEEYVFRLQFGSRVLRHMHALTRLQDQSEGAEAFRLLKEGLQPHRKRLLKSFFGWRRLAYKIVLDGELGDLMLLLRFVQGKGPLGIKLKKVRNTTKIHVKQGELKSIASVDSNLLDVTDVTRINEL